VKTGKLVFLLVVVGLAMRSARACDLCGCYTPQLETMPTMQSAAPNQWWSGLYGGVAEQFTHFGTLQLDGREVANPTGQHENSSITQLFAGYGINDRFAFQLNLPVIYRDFKRPEGFGIDRGTESGIGDMSILFRAVAFRYSFGARREFIVTGKNPVAVEHEADFTMSTVLLAGLKLPTGDTNRLKEEFHEIEIPGAPESGIHGHDLTLGTGSYDGIFGGITSLRYRNLFADASLQFTLRGDGAHQYDFANDLTWETGPGYYFIRTRETVLGLEFLVSGEHKDKDRFRGEPAEDTGITSLFVGPRLVASIGHWSAQLNVDLPVLIDNTALQAVPDYRIRGGISFHF
jgi:hypothetical protein